MKGRLGPATGYEFGAKRHYRNIIWKAFRDHCGTRRAEAQALLMPSSEGTEIDVALRNGFREYNLHVVDHNTAIVATLKRKYPRIQTYGVSLVKAFSRMQEAGIRLDVANLDLCSNVNAHMLEDLMDVAQTGVLGHGSLAAVTMLRGREADLFAFQQWAQKVVDHFGEEGQKTDNDLSRLIAVAGALALHTHVATSLGRHGTYRSTAGTQTMLWGLVIFKNRPEPYTAFDMKIGQQVFRRLMTSPSEPKAPDAATRWLENIWGAGPYKGVPDGRADVADTRG